MKKNAMVIKKMFEFDHDVTLHDYSSKCTY
jgi:hypothetical protein